MLLLYYNIETIKKALTIEKNEDFQLEIKNNLSLGLSYRKSYSLALEKYNCDLVTLDIEILN